MEVVVADTLAEQPVVLALAEPSTQVAAVAVAHNLQEAVRVDQVLL